MNTRLIMILVVSGLAVLFIIQNVTVVEIQLLFWSMQMSRSLLIFILLAIGVVIAGYCAVTCSIAGSDRAGIAIDWPRVL